MPLHQPRPWRTQSRACPRETQMQKERKTRQKITTPNRLQKHRKPLKTPSGIRQAKSQGSSAASLDDTEPHSELPSHRPPFWGAGLGRGGDAGARTHPSPGARGDGRLHPRSKGCGFSLPRRGQAVPEQGCGTRGAAWGLWSTSASRLALAASPRVHLVCVFLRSTLPVGYVRGEECRATLCHEIRLTFLG